MKKISKKDLTIEKALDALKKQTLLDGESKQLKGGKYIGPPILYGMFP